MTDILDGLNEQFTVRCTQAKGQNFFIHKELFIGDDAQLMLCDLLGDQAAEVMYESLLKKDPNDLDTLYNYGRFLWKVRAKSFLYVCMWREVHFALGFSLMSHFWRACCVVYTNYVIFFSTKKRMDFELF
jgi:hypothetical protein